MELRSKYQLASPLLSFFCESRKGKMTQTLFNLAEGTSSDSKYIWMARGTIWLPTPQGWMLTMNPNDKHCYLFDPITLAKKKLPPLEFDDLNSCGTCYLSSSPTDPDCMVLCAEFVQECLYFCHPGDEKWIRYEYSLGENKLTYIANCNDKLYGITVENNFAAIDFPPHPRITILEAINPEWPLGVCRIAPHLVESCGEMFLVECYYASAHSNKAIHISVMKRDSSKQAWDKVESIGGQVFLLGAKNSSASWPAASDQSGGIKGDCIYFLEDDDRRLYCFDIEEGFISVSVPCPDICNRFTPIWIVPAL